MAPPKAAERVFGADCVPGVNLQRCDLWSGSTTPEHPNLCPRSHQRQPWAPGASPFMMKVSEVMSRAVDTVDPSATVQEAATQMAELDVGAVVIGTADKIEGILTDRDIILRVVVDGRNPGDTLVRDVMSAIVFGCAADDPIETVFAQMREKQIRRMPVFDDSGAAVGIVTLGDLSKHIESPEQITEALRDISEPHRNRKVSNDEDAAVDADGVLMGATA